jgi:hypothetical protein
MGGVMPDKQILRRALCADHFDLDKTTDFADVFSEVDSFVALSQGNTSIEEVELYPYGVDPGKYELWDKVGQGVGNLKALGLLGIYLRDSLGEPDWEALARILPHIQNKITLKSLVGTLVEQKRCELSLERFKVILLSRILEQSCLLKTLLLYVLP